MISRMIQTLLNYLEHEDLGPLSKSYNEDNTVLELVCTRCPSEDNIRHLKELIFFTNEIKVTHAKGELVLFNENKIAIQIAGYYQFAGLYKMLKELHASVSSAQIDYPSDITFVYRLNGRCVLNYLELDQLQGVINPMIEDHDSIRVMGMEGEYTLRASLRR